MFGEQIFEVGLEEGSVPPVLVSASRNYAETFELFKCLSLCGSSQDWELSRFVMSPGGSLSNKALVSR